MDIKIKELLEKQLELLYKQSENAVTESDLCNLSFAMVKIAEFLNA